MNFEEVYTEHAGEVYRFLLRLTQNEHIAEEITQECFYRAYKKMDSYNGACKLSVWLCQIAKNIYFDECRKKRAIPINRELTGEAGLEDVFTQKEDAVKMHKIIHLLDEPYKEVFMLKMFGELSYKDISALFKKSENWSRVIFFRAKAKILQIWKDGK